jgi:hypothetical protein
MCAPCKLCFDVDMSVQVNRSAAVSWGNMCRHCTCDACHAVQHGSCRASCRSPVMHAARMNINSRRGNKEWMYAPSL